MPTGTEFAIILTECARAREKVPATDRDWAVRAEKAVVKETVYGMEAEPDANPAKGVSCATEAVAIARHLQSKFRKVRI
jgi:hypothetical protein